MHTPSSKVLPVCFVFFPICLELLSLFDMCGFIVLVESAYGNYEFIIGLHEYVNICCLYETGYDMDHIN